MLSVYQVNIRSLSWTKRYMEADSSMISSTMVTGHLYTQNMHETLAQKINIYGHRVQVSNKGSSA